MILGRRLWLEEERERQGGERLDWQGEGERSERIGLHETGVGYLKEGEC